MCFKSNYDTSNIYSLLKKSIMDDVIKIPDGIYTIEADTQYTINTHGLYVSSTLVTNQLFVKWLDECSIDNYVDMTYRYLNIVNSANAVTYDRIQNTYHIKNGFELHPVQGVNWDGASRFAEYFGATLLTELEWEICALAGNERNLFPWGNIQPNESMANYGNNVGSTTPVKRYPPNAWGLYDMAGNLREWCLDYYWPGRKYDCNNHSNQNHGNMYKVVKGGAWDKTTYHLSPKLSAGKFMRLGTLGIGFRLAFRTL